jgi:aspartokinase-like uncharacterized kinase
MKVVKIGGSLLQLAERITPVFTDYEVLLIPGGGVFSDAVRMIYSKHMISDETAHKMAILGMHQYGLFLSDISGIQTIDSIKDFNGCAILLPLKIIEDSDLPESWDVTSDSIACYVARKAGEREFIKLTDVDGIIVGGKVVETIGAGKLLNTTTCLDKSLPSYLQAWNMDCRVVAGTVENNIRRALEGDPVGTLVTGGT